jgi:hypothetical protein
MSMSDSRHAAFTHIRCSNAMANVPINPLPDQGA